MAGKGGTRAGGARVQQPLQFHKPPDRLSLLKMIPAHRSDRGSLSKFGQKWTKICQYVQICLIRHEALVNQGGEVPLDLTQIRRNRTRSRSREADKPSGTRGGHARTGEVPR